MKLLYAKEDLQRLVRDHSMDDCSRKEQDYDSSIKRVGEVRQKCK